VKKIFLVIIALYLFAEPIRPVPKFIIYNKDKAILGKMLFFDPVLSRDNKVSCASCHSPACGGADCRQFSIGVFGRIDKPMNSPTVYNAVFNCWQFWNGRAKTLADQAKMANQDPDEMGMDKKTLEEKIMQFLNIKQCLKIYIIKIILPMIWFMTP